MTSTLHHKRWHFEDKKRQQLREERLEINAGLYIACYWSAYVLATLLGVVHTIFNWKVLKMETPEGSVTSMYDIVPYAKTVPFHPLYNIVIWPIFAYIYLVRVPPSELWTTAFVLGASWTVLTIVIDLIGWVIIRHPWRMTAREMYVDYQPWITFIYLSILASPFIAALFI